MTAIESAAPSTESATQPHEPPQKGPRMQARARQPLLPIWLQKRPQPVARAHAPTPRDARWWLGILSVTIAILSLSFVGHVTIFGSLQQSQTQRQLYQTLRDSLANATTPVGQLDLNGNLVAVDTPIALMRITNIGFSQVVVQGTSSAALRDGAGHRRDSVMPGQIGTSVLFGRQSTYGGPFGSLSSLIPGDLIRITTGQGTSTFKVFGLRTPGDPLPVPAKAKESRLELVTATGPVLSPTGTLYVDAELVGTAKPAPAPVLTLAALSAGEGPMESDPSALLPFLFALQWLAVAAGVVLWLARKWGRWQTWIIGLPVLLVLGATTADTAIGLLPNLL